MYDGHVLCSLCKHMSRHISSLCTCTNVGCTLGEQCIRKSGVGPFCALIVTLIGGLPDLPRKPGAGGKPSAIHLGCTTASCTSPKHGLYICTYVSSTVDACVCMHVTSTDTRHCTIHAAHSFRLRRNVLTRLTRLSSTVTFFVV